MRIHHELNRRADKMASWKMPTMNNESRIANLRPRPPDCSVPPMTTIAMASSSSPQPMRAAEARALSQTKTRPRDREKK